MVANPRVLLEKKNQELWFLHDKLESDPTTHFITRIFQEKTYIRPGEVMRLIDIQKPWNTPNFLGAHILPCKKKTSLDLHIFNRTGKTMKKLQ